MRICKFFSLMIALAMLCATFTTATAAELNEGPELDKTKDYYMLMKTSMGDIHVKFNTDLSPIAVRNFVNLAEGTREFIDSKSHATVKRPYYNGIIFHRVGPNFMIQGGDPTGTGSGGPGYSIKDEYNSKHVYDKGGYFAMARTQAPNSGGSQFFLTEGPTPFLDAKYTQFGQVIGPDDLAIVNKIGNVPLASQNGDGTGKPAKDVTIDSIQVIRVDKGSPADKVFTAAAAKPAEKKDDAKPAEKKAEEKPAEKKSDMK